MLAVCCIAAVAQPPRHGRFKPEVYKAHFEEFVSKHAQLSADEAEKFFPLHHEMREKQRKVMHEIAKLKKERPAASATDKEYTAIVLKIQSLNVEMVKIQEAYAKKMCKTISAQKVYDAMNAEDIFHRRMLSEFNHEKKKNR